VLQAGRRPGPAAATCRESPPRKSRSCPPPTTPLPMTVARRRRMIKDHYVPRRNQPGQRLLGAQRSQLPPAVHLTRRPAAASRRSAGSEVHPARQRAAGWARCLRDPCPGCVTILRPGRRPRLIGGPVGTGHQETHDHRVEDHRTRHAACSIRRSAVWSRDTAVRPPVRAGPAADHEWSSVTRHARHQGKWRVSRRLSRSRKHRQ
jgi:hypothetical protein